jgi:hypothetical protein
MDVGLRRLDSQFFGVNLKLFSIGLDVLRTLDLNYFSRILVGFQSGWSVFLGSIGFGLSPKKEEVDRYWISWVWFFRIWINS